MFRPVSGGNGEKSLTDGESSVKGTDTVGQQRVGDDYVRDTCIGQQLSTEINSEDHVESVMEGIRNIGISGVNGEIRGKANLVLGFCITVRGKRPGMMFRSWILRNDTQKSE